MHHEERRYEVEVDKIPRFVKADEVRDATIDLTNMSAIRDADPAQFIMAMELQEAQKLRNMRKIEDRQLQDHLSCTRATPYQYSQHFGRRCFGGEWENFKEIRNNSGTPALANALGYVGEKEFFGVNMLGTFSSCNWGVPKESDVDAAGKAKLKKVFADFFSFGKSSFVLELSSLEAKVIVCSG